MRVRFPLVLVLVIGIALLLPVTGVPGTGPKPVPTRVQTLDLKDFAINGGRGMGPAQPTASQSAVIETDEFGLVGLSWDTPPAEGSVVKVRVREDDGWTAWLPIPWHDDHGPDSGSSEHEQARFGTDPMLTGKSDAVQVWVQTPDGEAPRNTQVHLVDTDAKDIQQTPIAQANAAPGMPSIITRAQWGADESKRNRGPVYCDAVKVGFVHHTVSSSTYTPEQAAGQVRNLYAWYTEGLKYSDMAYNYLVDRFGRLYEGRAGGLDKCVVGGHTAGLNQNSFAVSAMGNFDEYNPPEGQMDAIQESISQLMAWKLGLTKRDPGGKDTLLSNGSLGSGYWEAGQTATINRVSGHRDAGKTACPGQYLYARIPEIRQRASDIYRNGDTGTDAGPGTGIPDLIEPNPVTKEFNFRGSGNGDGVGVPKAGVLGQARDGKKAPGILRHYLAGTAVTSADDSKVIRVALGGGKQVSVQSRALARRGGAFAVGPVKGSPKTKVRVVASGDSVVVQRKSGKKWEQAWTGPSTRVRWAGTASAGKLGTAATAVRVGDRTLRLGTVTIKSSAGVLRVIANLRAGTEYLPYVAVAPRSWPEHAQRAMAIVSRTNALTAVYDAACGCHVTDEQFAGYGAVSEKGYDTWRKAVSGTAGKVVTYNAAAVQVPVFDSTGGATLNAADVWGKEVAYLVSATDPWSLQSKNSAYSTWSQQTRSQATVAGVFGLPNVVRIDLRNRMKGGAVAVAVATSSDGKTAEISGEKLRTELDLPSAFISRSVTPSPSSATSLSATLASGRGGSPVVVQASNTTTVALAAALAGANERPLYVIGGSGPGASVAKALRKRSLTAVGDFSADNLKRLDRLGTLRRITADNAAELSVRIAGQSVRSDRSAVFVASASDPVAVASAAMAASRARGYLLAVGETPSAQAVAFTKEHGKRTIVVAPKKVISDASAALFRKPVRLGASEPVTRAARLASLGPRRGEVILVDTSRPMAAAAAAASRQAVLLVESTGPGRALAFVQSSPAISVLRSVGASSAVVTAVRSA